MFLILYYHFFMIFDEICLCWCIVSNGPLSVLGKALFTLILTVQQVVNQRPFYCFPAGDTIARSFDIFPQIVLVVCGTFKKKKQMGTKLTGGKAGSMCLDLSRALGICQTSRGDPQVRESQRYWIVLWLNSGADSHVLFCLFPSVSFPSPKLQTSLL